VAVLDYRPRQEQEEVISSDPYAQLAARMNQFYTGAPQTDELLAILRELFSPEEAALATALPGNSTPLAAIAERAGRPAEQIEPLLESMAGKGLAYSRESKGVRRYSLLPLMPGIAEIQMMKGAPTPAKSRIAQLFDDYAQKGLLEEIHQGSPWARVLTVEQEIAGEVEVFPYERVTEIIKSATSLAMTTCYCREEKELLGHACNAPKDVCMQFGPFADYLVERGFARRVTEEEMLRALDRAEQAGLVHITNNAQTAVSFICNCCGDCCLILAGINKLNRLDSIAKSSFQAVILDEECIGCAACLDRCQVDALSMPDQLVIVDERRCIGCGLCVSVCPTGAIVMHRRDEVRVPFQTIREVETVRLAERGLA